MRDPFKKYFRLIVVVIITFFSLKLHAQDDSLFRFLKKIEYKISSLTVNKNRELYIINKKKK